MKLNIIMFMNVVIGAFTTPNFTDVEPDKAAKGLERAIIANFKNDKARLVKSYENLEMYFIGTFDDETGKIEQLQSPVHLLSCKDLIAKLIAEEVAKQAKALEEAKVLEGSSIEKEDISKEVSN